MQLKCPHCSKLLKVPDKLRGKTVKCPGCSKAFTIPAAKPKKKFKPIRKGRASDRIRGRSRRRSSAAESEGDGGYAGTKKKSKKGKILGIGCLVLILIVAGAGYCLYKDVGGITTGAVRSVVGKIIDSVLK